MINIRKGLPDDLEQITYVNRKSWKTTYPGIIDKKFLDNLSLTISAEQLEIKKNEIMEGKTGYIVAEDNKDIVGMLKYLNANDSKFKNTAEIQALYLLKDYQKKGIGTKMVNAAIKEMVKSNYKNMVIACIENNPSNEFYKRIGGEYIGKRKFSLMGKIYHENIYLYKDIDKKLNNKYK